MSYVTSVVLCTSVCEIAGGRDRFGSRWLAIQEWLAAHGFAPLAMVDETFSGSKASQMFVGGGAYNYFPEDEFAEFVLSLTWEIPWNVVLVMEPEDGPTKVRRPHDNEDK